MYMSSRPQTAAAQASLIPRPTFGSSLSLSAKPDGRNVRITWDLQFADLSDARIGVLTVQDGNSQAEFPLTKDQLQSKNLIYRAKSARLDVVLEVFSSLGKSRRESVMVVVSATPSPVPSFASTSLQTRPNGADPTNSTSDVAFSTAFKTPRVSRTFEVDLRGHPSAIPEPLLSSPPTVALRLPDPSATAPPEPLAAIRSARNEQQNARVAEPLVQPPIPIRQVKPKIPPNALSIVKESLVLKVRVQIDGRGKVVEALPIAPPGGLNQYLTAAVLDAARQWTFRPARRGNINLSSEMVLNFIIGPLK